MFKKTRIHPTLMVALLAPAMIGIAGCSSTGQAALEGAVDFIAPAPAPAPTLGVIPVSPDDKLPRASYQPIANGKYKLTEDLTVNTARFGPVTLTKGFESDGSSSPIADTEATRIAGFVHDALYSASGHLRFANGYPTGWTREQADDEYCELMARWNVDSNHRSANCFGVKSLPGIESAWDRLTPKREKRWAQWQLAG